MPTIQTTIREAEKELGYCRWDDPESGTKYGRWYRDEINHDPYFGENGTPFCAMGLSWLFKRVGVTCVGFPHAYCPSIVNTGRINGNFFGAKTARMGDVVLFDFNGDGVSDHVGLVTGNDGRYLYTIEFNTVSNGRSGCVARKTRPYKLVMGCIRPQYAGANDNQIKKVVNHNYITEDGYIGYESTKRLQEIFGTPVDGKISGQYRGNNEYTYRFVSMEYGSNGSLLVGQIQSMIGAEKDGVIGKETISKLQKFLGVVPDGYFGPQSALALQKWCNTKV